MVVCFAIYFLTSDVRAGFNWVSKVIRQDIHTKALYWLVPKGLFRVKFTSYN